MGWSGWGPNENTTRGRELTVSEFYDLERGDKLPLAWVGFARTGHEFVVVFESVVPGGVTKTESFVGTELSAKREANRLRSEFNERFQRQRNRRELRRE